MNAFREAYVYVKNKYAGILCETAKGYSFQYDIECLKSKNPLIISLTLPLQEEASLSNELKKRIIEIIKVRVEILS